MAEAKQGNLFIISAPSGAGKTTLCKVLRENYPDIYYSISHTTRAARAGETHGVDYFFVDEASFRKMIEVDGWAEWARVHDHYYGTSAEFLNRSLAEGRDVLLDIDVQGAAQIVSRYPDSITIFIMPPSLEVLRQRLASRGTDSPATIAKRLDNARTEMSRQSGYRHVIVNDVLSDAAAELLSIVARYRSNPTDGESS